MRQRDRAHIVALDEADGEQREAAYDLLRFVFDAPFVRAGFPLGAPVAHIDAVSDRDLTRLALVGDTVAGAYFLGQTTLEAFLAEYGAVPVTSLEDVHGKRLLSGIALAVHPDLRGQGIGRDLIESAEAMPFDGIIGVSEMSLGALPFWLKRRHLIALSETSWITGRGLRQTFAFERTPKPEERQLEALLLDGQIRQDRFRKLQAGRKKAMLAACEMLERIREAPQRYPHGPELEAALRDTFGASLPVDHKDCCCDNRLPPPGHGAEPPV